MVQRLARRKEIPGNGPRALPVIPDMTVVNTGGLVVAIAEVKAPWPEEHDLEDALALHSVRRTNPR